MTRNASEQLLPLLQGQSAKPWLQDAYSNPYSARFLVSVCVFQALPVLFLLYRHLDLMPFRPCVDLVLCALARTQQDECHILTARKQIINEDWPTPMR